MQTAVRKDWTPSEKRHFEDIAIQFISRYRGIPWSHAETTFERWLYRVEPKLYQHKQIIWSYVVTNWSD